MSQAAGEFRTGLQRYFPMPQSRDVRIRELTWGLPEHHARTSPHGCTRPTVSGSRPTACAIREECSFDAAKPLSGIDRARTGVDHRRR